MLGSVIFHNTFNKNIFVLFGIIKYLWTGNSGDSKFTVSLDVNYDFASGHSSRLGKP